MKEVLIVSDSHLNNSVVNKIFEQYPTINTCIHCGDVQDDPTRLKIQNLYVVKGNNDYHPLENKLVIEIENKRFFIAHGHLHDVELSIDRIVEEAIESNANIVCFGHTHQPISQYVDDILVINPGSVRFPRGGKIFFPTYAILTINHDQIELHFYNAKTHEIVDDIVTGKKVKEKKKKFSFFKK